MLAYNESDNEVVIIPLETEYDRPDVYTYESGNSRTIGSGALFKEIDMMPEQTIRYSPEWDEDIGGDHVEGGVVIDLEQEARSRWWPTTPPTKRLRLPSRREDRSTPSEQHRKQAQAQMFTLLLSLSSRPPTATPTDYTRTHTAPAQERHAAVKTLVVSPQHHNTKRLTAPFPVETTVVETLGLPGRPHDTDQIVTGATSLRTSRRHKRHFDAPSAIERSRPTHY